MSEPCLCRIAEQNPDKTTPMTRLVVEHLKHNGCQKVAAIGLCWGACPVFFGAGEGLIDVGASAHPSLNAGGFYGIPSPEEFASAHGKCPMLLMPCANDSSEDYGEEGKVTLAVRANGFECVTKTFADQQHGFLARGDASEEAVSRDVSTAITVSCEFFEKHMA